MTRLTLRPAAVAALCGLLATTVARGPAAPVLAVPPEPGAAAPHIVQLAGAPLAAYRGGLAGLAPTSPVATGAARLDASSPASARYLEHLDGAQRRAVAAVEAALGRPVVVTDRYRVVLNALAVRLTPAEARQVARLPGIVDVHPEAVDRVATDAGPAWSGAQGVWDGTALGRPEGTFGEGVIIGVIDTGINADHPSFAAVDAHGYEHLNPRGPGRYLGWCDPASSQYRPDLRCNDKLIGLWSHFASGNNPEDDNGHGSHTASTAGGNRLPAAVLVGPTISITRAISGVAPHANIAAYDACTGQGGCPESSTVAAIEQAVIDGVDVINYSIQVGQDSPWLNSRSQAFLAAREAGVFVSVAAGNAGPGPSTNFANAPWVLTVGNSTHDRAMRNALVRMDGGDSPPPADIAGKGLTAGLHGPHPIVYAKGVTNVDGEADDGRCLKAFPPGTFDSAIVLCDRGQNARVAKGQNVLAGGAAGYILANTAAEGGSLVGDGHFLPAVHIGFADGERLKAWLATGDEHVGEISGLVIDTAPGNGDVMNAGSSRGPTASTQCCRRPGLAIFDAALLDVLKPDVTAPGTDVFAAVASTEGSRPPEFDLYSGTSMASPHAAGAAALVRAVHRDWSPAAIHAALVTTARRGVRLQDGATPAGPLAAGAGHIQADAAVRAGLVLEESPEGFWAADPSRGGDPMALNLATLHDTRCAGRCAWARTLTSTSDAPVTWTAAGESPDGVAVTVEPAVFTLAPHGRQTVRITADVADLPVGQFAAATVTLAPSDDAAAPAHLPLSVRPVAARLPSPVVIETDQPVGSRSVDGLRTRAAAALSATVAGLVAATVDARATAQDPTPNDPYDTPAGTLVVDLTVPAGARRLVAEVLGAPSRDVDLFVGRDDDGDGKARAEELRCRSGGPAVREYCDLRDPQPGRWWVVAQNFQGSGAASDTIELATAVVPAGDAGNLTAAVPEAAEPGAPFAAALGWRLASIGPGDRWYGAVVLSDGAGDLGVVSVDVVGVDAAVPTATPPPTAARPTLAATRPAPSPTATPVPPTPTPDVPTPAPSRTPGPTATRATGGPGVYLPVAHKP